MTTEKEKKVLEFLNKEANESEEGDCFYFKYIAEETKLSIKEVKRAIHSLNKRGLTEYHRGLFNDDNGMIAGSGHCIAKEGIEFLKINL